MLMISGIVDGHNYQDQIVSPEEWAKIFGLEMPSKRSYKVLFSKTPSRPNNGSGLVKPALNVVANASIHYKGRPLSIRYFQRKIQKPGSMVPTYSPNKIRVNHQMRVGRDRDVEMLLFLMTTPQCEDSPSPYRPVIKFDKPEQQASKRLTQMRNLRSIMETVDVMSADELLQKVKGLQVRNAAGQVTRVPYNEDMDADELRASILGSAEGNEINFISAWQDVRTDLRGQLQILFDKGLIAIARSGDNTTVSWQNVNSNSQIIRYSGRQSPVDALMQHCMVPANQAIMIGAMEAAMEDSMSARQLRDPKVMEGLQEIATVGSRLSAQNAVRAGMTMEDIANGHPKAIVQFLLDNQALYHDLPNSTIYYYDRAKGIGDAIYIGDGGTNAVSGLELLMKEKPSLHRELVEYGKKIFPSLDKPEKPVQKKKK